MQKVDNIDAHGNHTAMSVIGRQAPDFVTRSTKGEVRLSDLKGRWVLLFCHPADFTPVCTSEFVALANKQKQFEELGVQLLGLSVDSVFSHMGWADWIEKEFKIPIKFPILEDISMGIAQAYGMIDSRNESTATVRACFFIDPQQNIQAAIHYPMHIGRSIDELIRVQKALIETFQTGKTTPADWQPGGEFMSSAADALGGPSADWLRRVMRKSD
jgi:peroxiredoxin (alkyl hydroperoxide reductase subunit C)